MRSLSTERKAELAATRRAMGSVAGEAPIYEADVLLLQAETLLTRVEEEVDADNLQGSGGGFRFILDLSVLDGGDTLA